jgi:hypothetical protein
MSYNHVVAVPYNHGGIISDLLLLYILLYASNEILIKVFWRTFINVYSEVTNYLSNIALDNKFYVQWHFLIFGSIIGFVFLTRQ